VGLGACTKHAKSKDKNLGRCIKLALPAQNSSGEATTTNSQQYLRFWLLTDLAGDLPGLVPAGRSCHSVRSTAGGLVGGTHAERHEADRLA
jgi:hypothetical protein